MDENNSTFSMGVLYLALTDEDFLKSILYFNGKDFFNVEGGQQWTFDTIVSHYKKYAELPTLPILSEYNKLNTPDTARELCSILLKQIELIFDGTKPLTNVQFIKDSFLKEVHKARLKSAMVEAADQVGTDPDRARQTLLDYVSTPFNDSNITMPRPITSYQRPDTFLDLNELIKFRFLCRGAAAMLIGASGIGKSVLSTQMAMSWALEKRCLGLSPTKPLKSLIVQAEDDDGDLGEMKDSIMKGMGIREGSSGAKKLEENVMVVQVTSETGDKFISLLDNYLMNYRPDILWINPVLSYLGGETNSQKDVSRFLRNGLNPLLQKYNVACMVVHHTAKPPKDTKKNGWSGSDFSYYGLGSVEWSNWARAVLVIVKTNDPNAFILRAPKRGNRLGWKDADGNTTMDKYISHSKEPGILCWHELSNDEARKVKDGEKTGGIDYEKLAEIIGRVPRHPDYISRSDLEDATAYTINTIKKYLGPQIRAETIKQYKVGNKIVYSRQANEN